MDQERIDELAFQSGITQHRYSNPKHPDLDGFIVSQEKLDRFVELMVQDTVNLLRQEWYDLNNIETQPGESARSIGYRNGRKIEIIKLIEKIKTHYGVKQ